MGCGVDGSGAPGPGVESRGSDSGTATATATMAKTTVAATAGIPENRLKRREARSLRLPAMFVAKSEGSELRRAAPSSARPSSSYGTTPARRRHVAAAATPARRGSLLLGPRHVPPRVIEGSPEPPGRRTESHARGDKRRRTDHRPARRSQVPQAPSTTTSSSTRRGVRHGSLPCIDPRGLPRAVNRRYATRPMSVGLSTRCDSEQVPDCAQRNCQFVARSTSNPPQVYQAPSRSPPPSATRSPSRAATRPIQSTTTSAPSRASTR